MTAEELRDDIINVGPMGARRATTLLIRAFRDRGMLSDGVVDYAKRLDAYNAREHQLRDENRQLNDKIEEMREAFKTYKDEMERLAL